MSAHLTAWGVHRGHVIMRYMVEQKTPMGVVIIGMKANMEWRVCNQRQQVSKSAILKHTNKHCTCIVKLF